MVPSDQNDFTSVCQDLGFQPVGFSSDFVFGFFNVCLSSVSINVGAN